MRRENREAAVQFLYMWNVNPPEDLREGLRLFFEGRDHPRDDYAFAEELIHGTLEHIDEIDTEIRERSTNWQFNRIARVDLAILRLAIHELRHRRDIPPIVSINEAIELTKIFSMPDSKRYINGILDQIKGTLDRPLREPA